MAVIESISVSPLESPAAFFSRVSAMWQENKTATILYLNIHVANCAWHDRKLKRILQQADIVYPDGAGIILASRILGQPLPCRLTAADWFFDLIAFLAGHGKKVYLLGGRPGIARKTLEKAGAMVPDHTIVGVHHGYIHTDKTLETRVIEEINRLKPDVLLVGFGTPFQEFWIDHNRDKLDVKLFWGVGAVMDFISGESKRCPPWMGRLGLEWLYRFMQEPRRMFHRYIIGNPWFMARILWASLRNKTSN